MEEKVTTRRKGVGYATELPAANVYTVPCPLLRALSVIGGKWKLPAFGDYGTRATLSGMLISPGEPYARLRYGGARYF